MKDEDEHGPVYGYSIAYQEFGVYQPGIQDFLVKLLTGCWIMLLILLWAIYLGAFDDPDPNHRQRRRRVRVSGGDNQLVNGVNVQGESEGEESVEESVNENEDEDQGQAAGVQGPSGRDRATVSSLVFVGMVVQQRQQTANDVTQAMAAPVASGGPRTGEESQSAPDVTWHRPARQQLQLLAQQQQQPQQQQPQQVDRDSEGSVVRHRLQVFSSGLDGPLLPSDHPDTFIGSVPSGKTVFRTQGSLDAAALALLPPFRGSTTATSSDRMSLSTSVAHDLDSIPSTITTSSEQTADQKREDVELMGLRTTPDEWPQNVTLTIAQPPISTPIRRQLPSTDQSNGTTSVTSSTPAGAAVASSTRHPAQLRRTAGAPQNGGSGRMKRDRHTRKIQSRDVSHTGSDASVASADSDSSDIQKHVFAINN